MKLHIFCVGRDAFLNRVQDDLHVWVARDRRVTVIQDQRDTYRLYGQRGGYVVPYDPSVEQMEVMQAFKMKIIPRAVARDMLEKDNTQERNAR